MYEGTVMNIVYLVSMFPCWSETFILNELKSHKQADLGVTVLSLKHCNEPMIHDDARSLISQTVYPYDLWDPRLWLLHIEIFLKKPYIWFTTLLTLLLIHTENLDVKLKGLAVFFMAPRYIAWALRNRPDHLHAHFATYPALMAWIIARFTGISYTFTAHAHDIYVDRTFLPLASVGAETVVTISHFNRNLIAQAVPELDTGRISIIRCGIDLSRFRYLTTTSSRERLRILSIGRLSGIKGFPYLLEGLKLLKETGVTFECTIVGDGPLRGELEELTRRLGLAEEVLFVGARRADEISVLMEEADVFVLACARDNVEGHDGIPVVFMEAMACGVPVIGTRLSGIPELIRHGTTGLCAEPENPASLRDAFLLFLLQPDKVNRMRQEARSLIESEFEIEKNSAALRGLFAGVAGRKTSAYCADALTSP